MNSAIQLFECNKYSTIVRIGVDLNMYMDLVTNVLS